MTSPVITYVKSYQIIEQEIAVDWIETRTHQPGGGIFFDDSLTLDITCTLKK